MTAIPRREKGWLLARCPLMISILNGMGYGVFALVRVDLRLP